MIRVLRRRGNAEKTFDLGTTPLDMSDLQSGASAASNDGPYTATLSAIKARIAEIDKETGAGDGSLEYQNCIAEKYTWEKETPAKSADARRQDLHSIRQPY